MNVCCVCRVCRLVYGMECVRDCVCFVGGEMLRVLCGVRVDVDLDAVLL